MPLNEVAPSLRAQGCPTFDDPALASLLFSAFCAPLSTKWLQLKPPQQYDAAWLATVTCRADIYIPGSTALTEQSHAFAMQLQYLDDCAAFGTKSNRIKGTKAWSALNKVPQARGLDLDFTQEHDGIVTVVDYHQQLDLPINVDYTQAMSKSAPGRPEYADQEMVSMVVLGARLKSPVGDQFAISAHTQSVSMGVAHLETGIMTRFASGMCTITPTPPFDRASYVSQSAVEKKRSP